MQGDILLFASAKFESITKEDFVQYVMMIYDNPKISQDDLVNMSGQSKGNIAKSLKKLEDSGYIKREINPNNRRKYMLKTTAKGDTLVPQVRKISKEWEMEVGITENSGFIANMPAILIRCF